jgi:hypothetical protein
LAKESETTAMDAVFSDLASWIRSWYESLRNTIKP